MTVPDFFILGAPKCGTTALAQYLSEHPQVFMCDPKEPHHFNTDQAHQTFADRADYLALFDGAGPEVRRVGEASVWYLYSRVAVSNIEAALPGARYIVLLRNPVEMAPSLHEQLVFAGNESLAKFEAAWQAQSARRQGKRMPTFVSEPAFLQYRDACSLGAQLQRLFDHVSRDRVLVLFNEDLRQDPRRAWGQVQAFLGLDDDGRQRFETINAAKVRKSRLLKAANDSYAALRRRWGLPPLNTGLLQRVNRWNLRSRPRAPLSPQLRTELQAAFAEDVALLARLTDRDLDHWLRP